MIEIGNYNRLKVVKKVDFGLYLDGEEWGEILLPQRYAPIDAEPESELEVFLYFDSEDRIIATTEKPLAVVNEFACLQVVSVNSIGAFLDWGLMKDLLVPFREQLQTMEEGKSYIVYIYFDKDSRRIAASAKINKFLDNVPPAYETGEEVDLLIINETDLGFNAVVNNAHKGILYKNEVFKPLTKGLRLKGYIKNIREDDKIDLSILPLGYGKVDNISQAILDKLAVHHGFLPLTDKTDPEIIYEKLQISKKAFKMAVGNLYKARLIELDQKGIRLISQNEK